MPLTALVLWAFLLSFLTPLLLLCGGLGLAAALYERILFALHRLAIEDGANRILAGREVGGDIEQIIRAGGRAPSKLVHQAPARCALQEGADDFGVSDVGELSALLREASDVVT